jgi:hypothetical protein
LNATETTPLALETTPRHRLAACLRPPGQGLRLEAVGASHPSRAELELYVRRAFEAKHGAVVRSFMPTLLAFRDRAGGLRGVTGVRGAHEDSLYLEQYLDRPVERALVAAAQARGLPRPARADVAEVGNLAGANCRAAVRIVAHLPAWLMAQRYDWIVFTATSALRQILAGFGAPLVELARADGAQLVGSRDEWGRYYETDPRVYAGYLRDAERLAGFAHLRH